MPGRTSDWANPENITSNNNIDSSTSADAARLYTGFNNLLTQEIIINSVRVRVKQRADGGILDDTLELNLTLDSGNTWKTGDIDTPYTSVVMADSYVISDLDITAAYAWDAALIDSLGAVITSRAVTAMEFTAAYIDYVYLEIDYTMPTKTVTPTISLTTTLTITPTDTQTITETSTGTVTETMTQTVTQTVTQTATQTDTQTATQTVTETVTGTATETITQSATQTVTETITQTVTQTDTQTATQTITETATQTVTQTVTQTATETITQSVTQTITETATQTVTQTITQTATPTSTFTPSAY
ncbi:MAG TPA: hypothetical protein PKJ42_01450, partial [Candidatus Goldiibacteriota bacterium]|nr:hypothetical protein [Candidatus Goldiibacteriota bacterium]